MSVSDTHVPNNSTSTLNLIGLIENFTNMLFNPIEFMNSVINPSTKLSPHAGNTSYQAEPDKTFNDSKSTSIKSASNFTPFNKTLLLQMTPFSLLSDGDELPESTTTTPITTNSNTPSNLFDLLINPFELLTKRILNGVSQFFASSTTATLTYPQLKNPINSSTSSSASYDLQAKQESTYTRKV